MNYENQILDALMFLDWDVPEEKIPEAWADQVKLMAGIDPIDDYEDHPDTL